MTSTRDIVLFVVLFIGLLAILVWWRRGESKRMKQNGLEAMSPGLRAEIEEERRQNLEKRQKFEKWSFSRFGQWSETKRSPTSPTLVRLKTKT